MTRDEILAKCIEGEGDCLLWRGAFDGRAPRPVIFMGYDEHGKKQRINPRTVLLGVKPATRTTFTCGDHRCMTHITVVKSQRALMKVHVKTKTAEQRVKIARGCQQGKRAKLTPEQVAEVRELRRQGVRQRDVAARMKISKRMVNLIEHNRCWREATPWDGLR